VSLVPVDDLHGIARGELPSSLSAADGGTPVLVLLPASTDEVRRIVLHARKKRTSVVPVGGRTTYFDNLALEGAIAVDVSAMDAVVSIDEANAVATARAGIRIATLDAALRGRGFCIPMRPDGYGDERLGSLVAHDTAAGLGAFHGPFADRIVGLEVVTGAGDVVQTGAARVLGSSAGIRQGVPDLGALFLAAEGRFGIVTEVAFQLAPSRPRARMRSAIGLGELEAVLGRVRDLRFSGALDSVAFEHEYPSEEAGSLLVHATPEGAAIVRAQLDLGEPTTLGKADGAFRGPPDRHRAALHATFMDGVDVHVGWDDLSWIAGAARQSYARAMDRGCPVMRTTVYPGPHAVNVGFHFHFPRTGEGAAAARGLCSETASALAPRRPIPYRTGRRWRSVLAPDPAWLATLRGLAAVLDPDAVLNPGVGLV